MSQVYISGPPIADKSAFRAAYYNLRQKGHSVVDLCGADAIYMLRGWAEFRVCKSQLKTAQRLKMKVIYQRNFTAKFKPKVRRTMILVAAVRVARKPGGWNSLTRSSIAVEAQCTGGLVTLHFGTMDELRDAVMQTAIRYEYLDLIAQGIASGHPLCVKLSPVLKHKAIGCLIDLGE